MIFSSATFSVALIIVQRNFADAQLNGPKKCVKIQKSN